MHWTIDGVKREAVVYAPSRSFDSGRSPVIFGFHGHGGDMQDAAEGMRFQEVWPEAVVVYMQGLPTNPAADPNGFGWRYEANPGGDYDLKFFDAVLATVRSKFLVDNEHIYATGFSNGGMFTYVLWGTRAKIFAAFAAVAGRIQPAVHLTEPKPLLHVAGERDMTVPYKVQLDAIATAREVNGAAGDGESCGQGCTKYASGKNSPVVTFIHGGGHVYPPGTSTRIVKFFKDHALGE
jgi:polyhydroxybutyrate depolymerase